MQGQKSRHARQKHKSGRAQVGDPACAKQHRRSGAQVKRILRKSADMQQVAAMIDGHNDHHQSAQKVDGVESLHNFEELEN